MENPDIKSKSDRLLDICKNQGYVPAGCYLGGLLVYALVRKGEDPCVGCNLDRVKCGGRAKRMTI